MLIRNRLPILFDDVDRDLPRLDILNRVFEDTFNMNRGTFTPELDVGETDKQFEVTVALPGMHRDDIEVTLENNVLTISGERRLSKDDDREYYQIENHYGQFSRSLPFPNIIDSNKIKAKFNNGLLTVTMPKLKEKATKKIKVS